MFGLFDRLIGVLVKAILVQLSQPRDLDYVNNYNSLRIDAAARDLHYTPVTARIYDNWIVGVSLNFTAIRWQLRAR